MVESRLWGGYGELLADLQAKLNTYLNYVLDGQLVEQYPQVQGMKVRFRLHYAYEPGNREDEFLRIVRERHLVPEGIEWEQGLISD